VKYGNNRKLRTERIDNNKKKPFNPVWRIMHLEFPNKSTDTPLTICRKFLKGVNLSSTEFFFFQ
jgi:hypothetical protein